MENPNSQIKTKDQPLSEDFVKACERLKADFRRMYGAISVTELLKNKLLQEEISSMERLILTLNTATR